MYNKYNLIYRLKQHERGSGLHAIYLSNTYSNLFNSINYYQETIPYNYRIWLLHKPLFYSYSLTQRCYDISCVRHEHLNQIIGLKATNGYSYYRKYMNKYHIWFPTIYDTSFEVNNIPSIGYYARDIRPQSNYAFIDFIKKIPSYIPVVTMGTKSLIEPYLLNRLNWKHTYDNAEFWKSCSHYFYYRPSNFEDPVPHTLLEAIQSKHRIISIKDINRQFNDGIDDLLSCIDYDDTFIESNSGKSCNILTSNIWNKYITQLVYSNFTFKPSILYKGLLYDWICKNLI